MDGISSFFMGCLMRFPQDSPVEIVVAAKVFPKPRCKSLLAKAENWRLRMDGDDLRPLFFLASETKKDIS